MTHSNFQKHNKAWKNEQLHKKKKNLVKEPEDFPGVLKNNQSENILTHWYLLTMR